MVVATFAACHPALSMSNRPPKKQESLNGDWNTSYKGKPRTYIERGVGLRTLLGRLTGALTGYLVAGIEAHRRVILPLLVRVNDILRLGEFSGK